MIFLFLGPAVSTFARAKTSCSLLITNLPQGNYSNYCALICSLQCYKAGLHINAFKLKCTTIYLKSVDCWWWWKTRLMQHFMYVPEKYALDIKTYWHMIFDSKYVGHLSFYHGPNISQTMVMPPLFFRVIDILLKRQKQTCLQ